jgi:hypothetical protein
MRKSAALSNRWGWFSKAPAFTLPTARESKTWRLLALHRLSRRLIAKAGTLISRFPQQGQHDLLRHMVKRVVINPEGQILRIELRTPFCYLQTLADEAKGLKETRGQKQALLREKQNQQERSCWFVSRSCWCLHGALTPAPYHQQSRQCNATLSCCTEINPRPNIRSIERHPTTTTIAKL